MRGRRSKYYSYISAKSVEDVKEYTGRDDLLVFRPHMTGMAGVVDSKGRGDYTCMFDPEHMYYDEFHKRYRMVSPDVAVIRDLRSRLERETNLARKFVEKCFSKFCGIIDLKLNEAAKKIQENFYFVVEQLFEDHDQMKKRRSAMDRVASKRYSWHEKRMPEASERDWLLGSDPDVALYVKMEMQEFKQYAYVLRMHEYIMRKFAEFVDVMLAFAEENDFREEMDDFIVDEFNRLAVQTRQEQERRIK